MALSLVTLGFGSFGGINRLPTLGLYTAIVATPVAPSDPTATAVASNRINVTWVDNSADVPGVNAVQSVTFNATPEAGTFTLTYDGETTAPIDWNADAATITAALEATAAFEVGDVSVDKTGNVITITYQGGLAAMSLPEITANSSLKQAADTIDVSVAQSGIADVACVPSINTTATAVEPVNEIQDVITTGTGTLDIEWPGYGTISGLTVTSAVFSQSEFEDGLDSVFGVGNTSVSYPSGDRGRIEFIGALAGTNIPNCTFPASTGSAAGNGTVNQEGVVGVHQVDTVTFDSIAVAGSCTIDGDSCGYNTSAATAVSVTGATVSATTPASGTITITWNDYTSHTPVTVETGTLKSVAGRPHIFTITLSDSPTEGTLKITKSGNDSTAWAYNAAAATVETAIEAIAGGYACAVTGSAGGPWTVTSDDHIDAPTWTASEVNPLRKNVTISVATETEGSPREWAELGFEVHRSIDGTTYSLLVDLGANLESWPDETCSPATQYWYKVRAYNAGGNSAFTSAVTATTPAEGGGSCSFSDTTITIGIST